MRPDVSKQIITVPDLGGADSVDVIEISVAIGDVVDIEQSLVVLESDKATMDVPSTHVGKVLSLLVKEGDTVSEGSAILELEIAAEAATDVQTESVVEQVDAQVDVAVEVAAPTAVANSASQLVTVPDIGSDGEVDVIELTVAVGDSVEEGDSLAILESDKATIEVPAPFAGEIVELKLTVGGKASTGSELAVMVPAASVVAESAPANVPVVPTSTTEPASTSAPQSVAAEPVADLPVITNNVHAGPAVRALARELGIDLNKVTSTGPHGRILKDDLHAYVKSTVKKVESGVAAASGEGSGIPSIPAVDFSQFGEIEKIKMSKIQRLTAASMQRSWLNVPHVTQFDDADITDLEVFRKTMKAEGEKRGVKVTPVPFMIKAIAVALQQNPSFNRSLDTDGEHLVQKKYINIGMAVDTPRGLVVPVIRDVDKKGIWEIAAEVAEVAVKARDGKLLPSDMQGGCFTISSLGTIGGKGFTPIVNAPEVGILGVSKAEIKPAWTGSEFAPRQMLPLSLSYDHRVINGGDAGRFMTTVVALLSDIRRLVM
jgi:pyruvate dehydrogenase E2 component (dihydrolipoamide acetyltransferase)